MSDEAVKRGPGRPRKTPTSDIEDVVELANSRGLEAKVGVQQISPTEARVTLEITEYWTISPGGRRKKVRRPK